MNVWIFNGKQVTKEEFDRLVALEKEINSSLPAEKNFKVKLDPKNNPLEDSQDYVNCNEEIDFNTRTITKWDKVILAQYCHVESLSIAAIIPDDVNFKVNQILRIGNEIMQIMDFRRLLPGVPCYELVVLRGVGNSCITSHDTLDTVYLYDDGIKPEQDYNRFNEKFMFCGRE